MIATPMIAIPCPIALEMSTQFAQPDLCKQLSMLYVYYK